MPLTKSDIEEAIKGKGDFIQINYLNRYLKLVDTLDLKKFILLKLAGINEEKGMIGDAIKNLNSVAEMSTTFREKIEFFMKEAELWIKFGNFEMADKAFQKAYAIGNTQEKINTQNQYIELYMMQGKKMEDSEKHRKMAEIYEKLFSMRNFKDKEKIREKLMNVYEKLGRVQDYERIKKTLIPQKEEFSID